MLDALSCYGPLLIHSNLLCPGASVVVILVHAVMMKPPSAGEEGIVMEDVVVN